MNLLLNFLGDITDRRTAYYALSDALNQKTEAIKALQGWAEKANESGSGSFVETTVLGKLRADFEALRKLRDALETAKEMP